MINFLKNKLFTVHQNGKQHVSEVFKYIGPGIIVTVGFIDPGNWAANLAAGASYGYELLWVVTLSTLMLILLQHNVAHLGIVRGQCLAECAYEFLPKWLSRTVLSTAGIAAVFFSHGIAVTELEQAEELLRPLIGPAAGTIFALALLFAGLASSATAGMTGASIFAGMFGESYDMKDFHSRLGLGLTYIPALLLILFITDSFQALLISQMFLSLQLPITIFLQLYMTSSRRVMGAYTNRRFTGVVLWGIGIIVTLMNIYLLVIG